MRCSEIIAILEELSPTSYAEEWDNVGLLSGRRDKEVDSVLLALDATDEVIEQAVRQGVSMLITHHPLIFKPLRSITTENFIGRRIYRLIQKDICYYAMHTNFDVMGMADAAADELCFKDREVLDITYEDEIAKEGIGRFGRLPRIMTLAECADYVKQRFSLQSVRIFGDADTELEKAAVCPGSGKSYITKAARMGADVYITGDMDHHSGLDALAQGMCVIDAGHFGLEQIFVPYMKEYLERKTDRIQVIRAEEQTPFQVL
ncbi:MAG: Nif3-like dinuclear metal center hexameric protein [Clostridiales bacterium]|nr:Nif3-like dinuclear metal center hexameric protein [Clostridiales bacterium]